MKKHIKGNGINFVGFKRPGKKVKVPQGRELEFVNIIKDFKQHNVLGKGLYVDSDGFICGTINEMWALACYCEGHTSASQVDIEQVNFAKKTGVAIENLLFK